MKPNSKIKWSVVAVIGFMMAAAAVADGFGNRGRIVEPGKEYFDKSYNELVGKWINWFVTEPTASNPALDPDGRFCDRNQDGKIWFLASTFDGIANRTCEVPAGKAIFVSLGAAFTSFSPEFPETSDSCLQMATDLEKVRCDVNDGFPTAPATILEVTLDGIPVEDPFAYRAQSPPGGFTLRIPNGSFLTDLGFPAGKRTPTVTEGYFLYLKPLKTGEHTLNLRMVSPDQTETGFNYRLIIN